MSDFQITRCAPPSTNAGALLRGPLPWLGLCGAACAGVLAASGQAQGPLLYLCLVPLLALGAAVALTRPEWVMLAVIAYIPFDSSAFRPLGLPEGLSVAKLLGLALVGALLFALVVRPRPLRLLDTPLDFAVLALAALMLLSVASSSFPRHTLEALLRMTRMFVLYLAVRNLVETREQLRHILWTVLLSGTAAAAYGIVEFYRARLVRVHDIRVGGVHMDPNDFAIAMIVVIVAGVHLFSLARRPPVRVAIAACLGISVWAFLLSGSRGGVVSLAVVGLIWVWRRPDRLRLCAVSALLVACSVPVWPSGVKQRFLGPILGSETRSVYAHTAEQSSRRRLGYLTQGLSLVAQRPLTGYGYDSFERLHPRSDYARFHNPMEDNDRFRPAHNGYLEYAVGMGLPGLLCFVLTLGLGWRTLYRIVRRSVPGSTAWACAQALELGLVGILAGNLFLSLEHSKYLWIILALAAATAHLASDREPDGESAETT